MDLESNAKKVDTSLTNFIDLESARETSITKLSLFMIEKFFLVNISLKLVKTTNMLVMQMVKK